MNTVGFCPGCGITREFKIERKPQTLKVKGEKIEFTSDVAICVVCEQDISNIELDSTTLTLAYDEYRKRHGLLFPSDIKQLREKYGLSQRGLSRLLNWGEVTIQRYESGTIQDQSHNDILMLLADPLNMKKIFERAKSNLTSKEISRIEHRLSTLLTKTNMADYVESMLSGEVSVFTGFRAFSFSRFANTVLYYAEACAPLFKTKLLKLLWYSDFLNFKRTTISLTGSKYVHFPYGPVPKKYEFLLGVMDDEIIDVIPTSVFDYAGEVIRPKQKFDPDMFNADETDVLNTIKTLMAPLTCADISKQSHEEDPYKDTNEKELISYERAKELSIV